MLTFTGLGKIFICTARLNIIAIGIKKIRSGFLRMKLRFDKYYDETAFLKNSDDDGNDNNKR